MIDNMSEESSDILLYENNKNTNKNNDNLLWIKTGCLSKRGYCKHCKDIMVIDYYFRKYIKDMNMVPVADLYCFDSTKQLTKKCYNNVFLISNL
jgi:hypothetical protein